MLSIANSPRPCIPLSFTTALGEMYDSFVGVILISSKKALKWAGPLSGSTVPALKAVRWGQSKGQRSLALIF
jgi:hypothetical protein